MEPATTLRNAYNYYISKQDDESEMMQELGYKDASVGTDSWCGTASEKYGIPDADWDKLVVINKKYNSVCWA